MLPYKSHFHFYFRWLYVPRDWGEQCCVLMSDSLVYPVLQYLCITRCFLSDRACLCMYRFVFVPFHCASCYLISASISILSSSLKLCDDAATVGQWGWFQQCHNMQCFLLRDYLRPKDFQCLLSSISRIICDSFPRLLR